MLIIHGTGCREHKKIYYLVCRTQYLYIYNAHHPWYGVPGLYVLVFKSNTACVGIIKYQYKIIPSSQVITFFPSRYNTLNYLCVFHRGSFRMTSATRSEWAPVSMRKGSSLTVCPCRNLQKLSDPGSGLTLLIHSPTA